MFYFQFLHTGHLLHLQILNFQLRFNELVLLPSTDEIHGVFSYFNPIVEERLADKSISVVCQLGRRDSLCTVTIHRSIASIEFNRG